MTSSLGYMELCRLCLVKDKVTVPIFGDTNDVRQIFLKITACLPVKVSRDDNLPKKICDTCLYKIDLLYQFWNTTINAEKQLIQWLNEIGVDAKNVDASLQMLPQSHAHPHAMQEEIMMKEERIESETKDGATGFSNMYTEYPYQNPENNFDTPPVVEETTTAKRKTRGRPAGKKKAKVVIPESEDEDSIGSDRLGNDDTNDSDSDGGKIAKQEADSDEDYVDNPESLEPTTFVDVPSAADAEQPGPSGLSKPATITAGTSDQGSSVVQPEEDNKINGAKTVYEDFVEKIKSLPFIKIKKEEPKGQVNVNQIANNLTKCGLIVKKIPVEVTQKTETDSDDPDYEIETLDDDDSDLDYVPNVKPVQLKLVTDIPKVERRGKDFIQIQSTNYLCIMCNEKFDTFELLNKHMRSTVPCRVVEVACPICDRKFPSRSRCTSHMTCHKEKPKYPCDKCGKVFSNPVSLQVHSDMYHTEYFDAIAEGFKCKICDHKSTNKQQILHHINLNHLHVSTLLCDICGKSFLNENGLRAHILTHTNTKPFLCQICSKAFKMKSALRAHIKTHNHERRFVCDECGKTFKKNSTLSEHKKYHAGDFSYPCNWCNKRFVSKSLLNAHMKNHSA